jgi:outer membrane protein OmpA-like peptidoglycan-associated protein
MTPATHATFFSALALSAALGGLALAQPSERGNPLLLAQAPPPQTEQEKAKRKEQERQKGPPPGEKKGPPEKGPPPKAQNPTPPGGPPAGKNVLTPQKELPPREKQFPSAQPLPPGPPPGGKSFEPPTRKATEQPFERKKEPEFKKELPKQVNPGQPTPPAGAAIPSTPKGPAQGVVPQPPRGPAQAGPPPGPGPGGAAAFKKGPAPGPVAAQPRFEDVQKARKERVEEGGRRVIEEPGNRIIVKQGDRIVIRHDEAERFRRGGRDVRSERRPDGRTEAFYVRPDGMRVVSVMDPNGRLVRRYRRGPDGRDYNMIDNRRFYGTAAVIGIGAVGLAVALNLSRPRVTIPREKYIVDYDRASDDDIYEAFMAPPVEDLERAYSLEEVRDNYLLRDRMRRVDLDSITFEFGAFDVSPDQYSKLERVARAMLRVLERNPDEVFLVEGHTDAVGGDVDNLSLSDRRAEAVAGILSETFGVPPENLITQGYGKQFLKIDTLQAEPLNRRVAVRRVTPLMAER